jgi:chromosome segregation ATPase
MRCSGQWRSRSQTPAQAPSSGSPAGLYRHGGLIRDAIEQAAESNDTDRAALAEQRASLAKEITRTEHAIERYQDAFENGNLDPARFNERLTALDTRLDTFQAQD